MVQAGVDAAVWAQKGSAPAPLSGLANLRASIQNQQLLTLRAHRERDKDRAETKRANEQSVLCGAASIVGEQDIVQKRA